MSTCCVKAGRSGILTILELERTGCLGGSSAGPPSLSSSPSDESSSLMSMTSALGGRTPNARRFGGWVGISEEATRFFEPSSPIVGGVDIDVSRVLRKLSTSLDAVERLWVSVDSGGSIGSSGVAIDRETEPGRELSGGDCNCNRAKSRSKNAGCIPSAIKSS